MIAVFRDPKFLCELDDDLISFEKDDTPWEEVDKQPKDKTTKWKSTAKVTMLPKAISSGGSISYRTAHTAIDDGIRWATQASIGMSQVATWTVEPAAKADLKGDSGPAEGRLVLVERIEVTASRLLMGTIKGRYETEWSKTHGRILTEAKRIQDAKTTAPATAT